ncbi:MAG: RsmD family RNA methyltransferase [Microthrixaceae bacterium]
MRVVAGSARGLRLRSPDSSRVRPTSDRVRESLFNSLGSRGRVEGADFVDLFAGTGALGIEALSRGAGSCVFIDADRASLDLVRHNLAHTRLEDRAELVEADALGLVSEGGRLSGARFDVALADPPYAFDRWVPLMEDLRAQVLVAESDREIDPGARWQVTGIRTYGTTVVTILESAEAPQHPERER